jgi:hypothetical protein
MITASTAKANSNTTREDLTYINSLITGATEDGIYTVFVDGRIFDDNMLNIMIDTYGYRVTKSFNDMGTFPTYKIEWNLEEVNIPSQTALFFSSDVFGGARWFYAMMDFVAGQIVGLVDTGLNVSDYSLWNVYPLQNKGYGVFFGGSDMKVFFIDSTGSIVEQFSSSTNNNYDNLEGQWVFWNDYNNDVFRAFNGTDVYSLSYENYQDVYIDWDWDGASNGGTFQYTLYDDNDVTDSIRLVKSDATMVQLDIFDVTTYYHNAYVYMNIIVVEKFESSTDKIVEYKIYNEQGTILETIDLSGYDYNNQDVNMFGNSNFNVILYNYNDNSIPYRIITYLKGNSTLINETHDRGSEYQNWNTYTDSLGMFPNEYYSNNFYVYFYDDSYTNEGGNFYGFSYCDLYYIETDNGSSNLEVLQDSGSPDKFISTDQSMSARNLFSPFVDVDGYVKFKLINSTGNVVRNSGILFSDLTDAGWDRIVGDFYLYKIQTYNGDYDVYNVYCLKYDNSVFDTYQFVNTNYYDDWSYNNIYFIYNGGDDTWRYFNLNSDGFQFLSSGIPTNIYGENWYYNSDNIMKNNIVIHYPTENKCTVITDTTFRDNISLPTNNSYYDLQVMKDYFVYLYNDASTNNLIAKAYDFTGNEVNSVDTGISNWAEGINSAENRFWFSQYTDGSGQMLRYHLFTNNYHETIDMSNYSTNYSFNDVVWWD